MHELLDQILNAHGGMDRWNKYEKVEATIVSGGGFFPLKGVIQDADPRRMAVWLHQERSSVSPYGAPDQRTMFTPQRIAIEKLDGTVVAERPDPRDSFAGHQMSTPWDALHRAYFNGEALWTYMTTPFLLAMDGVAVEEAEPWQEGADAWRVCAHTSQAQSRLTALFRSSSLMRISNCGATTTVSTSPEASKRRSLHRTMPLRTEFDSRRNAVPIHAALIAGLSRTC
jgi:hypothetical protein